jgi:hippurate hydrolase
MKDIAVLVAQAHGCEAELRYQRLLPATVNSRTEAELCLGALRELAGEDQVDPSPAPMMASEDFAFLLEARPGCYVLAGNGVGKDGCAVHNPNYDFNDQLIPLGAAYWVRLVETALRAPAASHSSAYSRASSQVSVSHSSSASGRPARTKSPNR